MRSSSRTLLLGMSATPRPAWTRRFCAVRLSTAVIAGFGIPEAISCRGRKCPKDSGWPRSAGKPSQRSLASGRRSRRERARMRYEAGTTTKTFSEPSGIDSSLGSARESSGARRRLAAAYERAHLAARRGPQVDGGVCERGLEFAERVDDVRVGERPDDGEPERRRTRLPRPVAHRALAVPHGRERRLRVRQERPPASVSVTLRPRARTRARRAPARADGSSG